MMNQALLKNLERVIEKIREQNNRLRELTYRMDKDIIRFKQINQNLQTKCVAQTRRSE